jgi:hypothetical protein
MARRKQGQLVLLALLIVVVQFSTASVYCQSTPAKRNNLFKIKLSSTLSSEPVSGRLLVFMTRDSASMDVIEPSLFELEKVWVAAKEVRNLQPGNSVDLDADSLSYPAPFSTAAPGDYQIMALLDLDHSYSYSQMGPGDLRSGVVSVPRLNSAESEPISLLLEKRVTDPNPISDTQSIKFVEFQSAALSSFWGKPIMMRAAVLLDIHLGGGRLYGCRLIIRKFLAAHGPPRPIQWTSEVLVTWT